MSSKMKMRWFVVCCLWGLALAVTFWNGVKINTIAKTRTKNETTLREIDFHRQNAEKLSLIIDSRDALFLPVESIDLGIVAVRSRLNALAAAFDFADVKIRTDISQVTTEQVPFAMSMNGSLSQAVGFITALNKYLYLTVRKTNITTTMDGDKIDIQIELMLRCQIVAPPQEPGSMPHVTSHQTGAEAESL
jgi:hypothetical protein